jgi:hypothetical protein
LVERIEVMGEQPENAGHKPGRGGSTRFKPGVSGNPAGKPLGARHKLATSFLEACHKSFLEHGPDTLERLRIEDPASYVKVMASLVPKEIEMGDGQGGPLQIIVRRMTMDVE